MKSLEALFQVVKTYFDPIKTNSTFVCTLHEIYVNFSGLSHFDNLYIFRVFFLLYSAHSRVRLP